MRLRFWPRLAMAALAVSTLSAHAEVDALVREAQSAMARGQPLQAFELLSAQEVNRAGDPDFDLALGIAANASAKYSRAILALERVVAVQPENAQARGELGRAMFAVGDRRSARILLADSQLAGVPLVAGETIDQLLLAVDRVEALGQSSYKGYVEAAVGHDSNANGGPALRNLAVPAFGGAVVTIDPSGVKTAASYVNLSGGLSGRYILDPRWSLIGNGYASIRHHGSDGRPFDYQQFDLNGGVSYRVERQEFTLVAQFGSYAIDHARVRDTKGAVAEWTYRFDGFRQFSAYGQFGRLSYPNQPVSDVDRHVVGLTYSQMARAGLFGYGGIYTGRESEKAAGVAHLGHRLIGWRGGLQMPLGPKLAAYATLAQEHRRFGGTDPLFLEQRSDRQTDVSFGLSWVPAAFWRVTPQAAWTRTRSNMPLADFQRRIVSLAVRREF